MVTMEFGRLEKVDLREGWPFEDRDFTPWLAESPNLALLGETVGMDLELVNKEQPVGSFRADLLCLDTDTERHVLIENQLEKTNHTHLGQLVTYASGLQTATVIWIAKSFRDEHIAALEWLNDHTSEQVRFFGLEVELWRIGDSTVAPKFNVVVKPNEWMKSTIASHQSGDSSAREKRAYWEGFVEWFEENSSTRLSFPTPRSQHWLPCRPYGVRGIKHAMKFNTRTNEVGVELYLGNVDAKARFARLSEHQESIDKEYGSALDWQLLPNRIACRVLDTLPEADWQNVSDRTRQYQWMHKQLLKMIEVMSPYIPSLAEIKGELSEAENDDV